MVARYTLRRSRRILRFWEKSVKRTTTRRRKVIRRGIPVRQDAQKLTFSIKLGVNRGDPKSQLVPVRYFLY